MGFSYKYPRPAVTVDIIIVSAENQILLIQRLLPPFKDCWALPGGFIDMEESLIEAAERELFEETGLKNIRLEQFRSYGDVNRDPRGRTISVVFFGAYDNRMTIKAGDDAKKVKWFDLRKLPELAFDHVKIIKDFINSRAH